MAYSPFASGRFPSPRSKAGRVLSEIALQYSVSPRQIALAFLIRHPIVFTIPKTSQISHVEEISRAADITLSIENIERLNRTFPLGSPQDRIPTI